MDSWRMIAAKLAISGQALALMLPMAGLSCKSEHSASINAQD
jgi:hypothetical protein